MKIPKYNVAKEFSVFLGTRYAATGEHSGEALREELVGLLSRYPKIEVSLDGMDLCGPSASEEAFGGLVRVLGRSVLDRVTVTSRESAYSADMVQRFMREAADRLG